MRERLPDDDSNGGRVRRSFRFAIMLAPAEYAAYKATAGVTWLDTAAWARQVLNEAVRVVGAPAPAAPAQIQKDMPAGPGNPHKKRRMTGRGNENMSWAEYYAGRLVDNGGPNGAPRFRAVLLHGSGRLADEPAAHIAYGEAMAECFARGEPVQPGGDHAWTTYLRENER